MKALTYSLVSLMCFALHSLEASQEETTNEPFITRKLENLTKRYPSHTNSLLLIQGFLRQHEEAFNLINMPIHDLSSIIIKYQPQNIWLKPTMQPIKLISLSLPSCPSKT